MSEVGTCRITGTPWRAAVLALLLAVWLGCLVCASDSTQEDVFKNLSLEDLMNLKLSVASKTAMSIRDAPGIVTVITREEILASGARDLIDVLRLVPGYEFGIDVRGVTSIGIRGLWAHEGKVLLLWDGQVMNELLFPSVQVGNRFPVDLIERVEVIRGPGSAVYGGGAELGVINVISRPAAGPDGVVLGTNLGWMSDGNALFSVTAGFGKKFGPLRLDVSVHAGRADRSDRVMTDYKPDNEYHSFDMSGQERLFPLFLNVGVKWNDFQARLIVDRYHLNDRTMYGINLPPPPARVNFETLVADASYDFHLGSKLKITPRFNYTRNAPWECKDPRYSPPIYLDKWCERYTASATVNYSHSEKLDILTGFEYYRDIGHAGPQTYFMRDPTKKELSYYNLAAFAQGVWLNDILNVTLGARFERNSEAGNSFVPRIAVTRIWNKFHFKALYSHAFRSPGIENISRYSSEPIRPEKLVATEFEFGYMLKPTIMVSANIFFLHIKDPIVFFIDPILNLPAYHNSTQTGTRGVEAQVRLQRDRVSATLAYSYYRAVDNEVPDYVVNEDSGILLGFPHHKVTFNGSFSLLPFLSLDPTFTYLSKRYYSDPFGVVKQPTEDPVFLLDLFATFRLKRAKGLMLQVGVHDILGTRYSFIQPYNDGGSAPLPGPTRELQVKAVFSFD